MKKSTHILISFFFLVISIAIFWSYIVPENKVITTPDTYISDSIHLNFSLKYILSFYLKNFRFPWWIDTIGNGFPLIGESQIGAFYIPNILLFAFLPFPYAYNIGYMVMFWICSIGAFYYYKLFIKNNLLAFIASLFFTYSYPMSVQQTHYNLLQAYCLLPIIMFVVHKLFIEELPTRVRIIFVFLLSLLLSQQFNTGYSGMSIISGILILLYIFIFTFTFKKYKLNGKKSLTLLIRYNLLLFFKRFILFGVALVITFALSCIQLIPIIEYSINSNRLGGMNKNFIGGAYPIQFLLTYFHPFITSLPNKLFVNFSNLSWEGVSFIGFTPILLFFYTFLSKKVTNIHKRLIILIMILFFLMLGISSPLYFLYTLPPLSFLRTPFRFMILANFFIILFSFIYIDKLHIKYKFISIFILSIVVIDLTHNIYLFKNVHTYSAYTNIRLNKLLNSFMNNQNSKLFVLGLEKDWYDSRKANKLDSYYLDMLNSLPSAYVSSYFHVNSGNIFHGSDFHEKYVLYLYNQILSLYSVLTDKKPKDIEKNIKYCNMLVNSIKLFGSTHILSVKPLPLCLQSLVFEKHITDKKYSLYSIKKMNEPFYFPSSIIAYLGESFFIKHLEDINYKEAYLKNNRSMFLDKNNSIISMNKNNHSAVIYTAKDNQLLIHASLYYPGWVAYIDHVPVKIHRVNFIQQGINIEKKGFHKVEFKHRPIWKKYVIAITISSHIMIMMIGFSYVHKKK